MKVAIVVPVYNHGEPLRATAARLAEFGLPIFIVDDGSDEPTKRAIAEVAARYRTNVVTLAEQRRQGSRRHGGATRRRRSKASRMPCKSTPTGSTTSTTCRSCSPRRRAIQPLSFAASRVSTQSVPKSRLYGRKLTAFWVAIETLSLRMPDTMCGYRVYPLAATIALLDSVRLGRRMDFDVEVVVRLYWRNVTTIAVPTAVIYPVGGRSNFRMLADNALITKLHAKLTFGMLLRSPLLVTRRVGAALHWAELRERGGGTGMRLLFAVYRLFGRAAFTVMLYPVAAYFCIAAGSARRASRDYLRAVRARLVELGQPVPRRFGVFHHVLAFGNAVLDKVAMWADALPKRAIAEEDVPILESFRGDSRGALFIGSHLGNLEVLRAFGDKVQGMKVNALVFTRHSPKFNRVLASVSPETLERMIQVDSLGPEAVIALRDKLAAGEHVAIVADRVSVRHKDRSLRAPFLGRPAPFPEGPFVLASLLECPVYLLFCLKVDGRYRVFIEPFADPLVLPREGRQRALEHAIARYAARLEAHCLLAPTQWFNFFDFWGQTGGH